MKGDDMKYWIIVLSTILLIVGFIFAIHRANDVGWSTGYTWGYLKGYYDGMR